MKTAQQSSPVRRRSRPRSPRLLAAALALCVVGCQHGGQALAPPPQVVALPVHPDAGTGGGPALRYPVEVAPRYANAMSFRVAGKLIERRVRIGDVVKKGEVVARLDPADARKQVASAQAALDAAGHRVLFAQQQLDRDRLQAARNLIAATQLEQTQDQFSAAQAQREQAAAQLVIARNNLQYQTLVADHDGAITSENADTGQVVTAGQTIYRLAWSGATDVTLDAAADDVGRIAIGEAASVSFPALPGRRFNARVREIAPAADPQSRTYPVKLTLLDAGRWVRFGMTGDATLLADASTGGPAAAPTFTIPATALFHDGSRPAVWVVRPGGSTLELRPVVVTRYGNDSVVVADGLRDGDTVVLAGVHTVYAGERATPVGPLFDDGAAR